uniref:C2H2-type domain-containing protein n=1 Tax=Gouania willdenowi TaxID=441366 RepID=A0A8C5ELG8_GOUWI
MDPIVSLRNVIRERLCAAAEEIFTLVQQTIDQYEERLYHQQQQQQQHSTLLHNTGWHHEEVCDEAQLCDEEEEPNTVRIKEEEVNSPHVKDKAEVGVSFTHTERERPHAFGESFSSEGCDQNSQDVHHDLFNLTEEGSHPPEAQSVSRRGKKHVKCGVCGKAFKFMSQVQLHHRIHTGEKPHCCHVCGKRFIQKQHLKNHIKIHTGEKPYSCETCGKGFIQKQHLKKHSVIHMGEKPHACPTCGKSFSEQNTLMRHMRTHSGEASAGNAFYDEELE